jgi:hypothetical protein
VFAQLRLCFLCAGMSRGPTAGCAKPLVSSRIPRDLRVSGHFQNSHEQQPALRRWRVPILSGPKPSMEAAVRVLLDALRSDNGVSTPATPPMPTYPDAMNEFTKAAAAVNLRQVVRPERLWETRGSRLPVSLLSIVRRIAQSDQFWTDRLALVAQTLWLRMKFGRRPFRIGCFQRTRRFPGRVLWGDECLIKGELPERLGPMIVRASKERASKERASKLLPGRNQRRQASRSNCLRASVSCCS